MRMAYRAGQLLDTLSGKAPPRLAAAMLRTWFQGWCTKSRFQKHSQCIRGCPHKDDYFSREYHKLDTNQCQSVLANQPAFVTCLTSKDGRGWSLCILPIEMPAPDARPAEFIFAWLPSTLIEVCSRSSCDAPMKHRDLIYTKGYYAGWNKLPVVNYPKKSDLTRPNP